MSSTRIEFRLAGEADWPLIWPIFAEVVRAGDTYVYHPDTDWDAGRAIWLPPAPEETWLAFEAPGESGGSGDSGVDGSNGSSGRLLGTYKTGANRPGPGSHVGTASYMVDRRIRGTGVGRAMVLHSLDRARALGFHGVQFNAVAASNVYAVRLYEDLGFFVAGRIPAGFRHPEKGFVDLLVMYRDLTGG